MGPKVDVTSNSDGELRRRAAEAGTRDEDVTPPCGWMSFHPKSFQRFRTPRWLLFCLCWVSFVQVSNSKECSYSHVAQVNVIPPSQSVPGYNLPKVVYCVFVVTQVNISELLDFKRKISHFITEMYMFPFTHG